MPVRPARPSDHGRDLREPEPRGSAFLPTTALAGAECGGRAVALVASQLLWGSAPDFGVQRPRADPLPRAVGVLAAGLLAAVDAELEAVQDAPTRAPERQELELLERPFDHDPVVVLDAVVLLVVQFRALCHRRVKALAGLPGGCARVADAPCDHARDARDPLLDVPLLAGPHRAVGDVPLVKRLRLYGHAPLEPLRRCRRRVRLCGHDSEPNRCAPSRASNGAGLTAANCGVC
mmetsp:Transcript_107836/g.310631  ORF Transcript_107836/g.310631 Transcript_107836/m.310631 type:complete len:234 (+) Transcript_107836:82-783(+)